MEPEDKSIQDFLDLEMKVDPEDVNFDFDHFDEHMEPYDLDSAPSNKSMDTNKV